MAIKVYQNMLDLALKEHGNGKISVLAKKMGIHPSYVYKVRKYDMPVGGKFIKEMRNLMGLSFSSLFYYSEYDLNLSNNKEKEEKENGTAVFL